jgi:hypothetical protein
MLVTVDTIPWIHIFLDILPDVMFHYLHVICLLVIDHIKSYVF